LAPVGVPGELWTGGDGLARCYHSAPALTAEKFVPDPFSGVPGARLYRTGDQVRWRSGGQIEFLGRLDHQVKIRNFRVEPAEVERVLNGHPHVLRAAVIARGQTSQDKRLVAYVIPAADSQLSPETLRDWLSKTLPEHMIPASFSFLQEFPLTATGKFDLRLLPEPVIAPPPYLAPRTAIERTIATVWSDLLHIPNPGIQANFFDLGGHSMLALQVHDRLQQCLGRRFPLLHLFRYPTISALAEQLSGSAHADDSAQQLRERAARQTRALRRPARLQEVSR
jgi:acyl carrier protein